MHLLWFNTPLLILPGQTMLRNLFQIPKPELPNYYDHCSNIHFIYRTKNMAKRSAEAQPNFPLGFYLQWSHTKQRIEYLFSDISWKRTTKLFVAQGSLLTAALSLHSYISHEEALLSVLSNPLLYLSRLISPRVPDGDRLGGLSYKAGEQKSQRKTPICSPQGVQQPTSTNTHMIVLWVRLC